MTESDRINGKERGGTRERETQGNINRQIEKKNDKYG